MNAGPMCTRIGGSDGSGAVPVAPATPSRSRSSRLSSPARSWSVSTRRLVRPCCRRSTRAAARRYGEPPPQGALPVRRLEVHLNLRGCRYTDPRVLRCRRAFGCRAALSSKSRTWDSRSQETLAIGSCAGESNDSEFASPGFRAREYSTLAVLIARTRELSPGDPRPVPNCRRRSCPGGCRRAASAHAQLAGRASVTDGDTVRVCDWPQLEEPRVNHHPPVVDNLIADRCYCVVLTKV